MTGRSWRTTHHFLFAAFLAAAALNMLGVRAGFLTDHLADLVVPAWMYVVARGLASPRGRTTRVQRTLGATPERAALGLFAASTLSEVSQRYWPNGFFPGRFDPLDVVAYGCGIAACYAADRLGSSRADSLSRASAPTGISGAAGDVSPSRIHSAERST